jgi:tRNA A58 N-methylase Trm61
MDVETDDDVLEIGFGNGANLALLTHRAPKGHVVGAEVSERRPDRRSYNDCARRTAEPVQHAAQVVERPRDVDVAHTLGWRWIRSTASPGSASFLL